MLNFIFAAWRLRKARADRKYDCCRKTRNMRHADSGRSDLYLEVCRACGRRHFYAKADTGQLGAAGSVIGR